MTFRESVTALLRLHGHITNRQLRQVLGLSRQGVWKQMRPLVVSGELVIQSAGRGVRYVPGPGMVGNQGVVRGASDERYGFWTTLAEATPRLAYVAVGRAARGTHRHAHGRALVDELHSQSHVVLDFDGVEQVSDAFAEAVLAESSSYAVMPINACPRVRLTLERARRNALLRPWSTYGE